MSERRILCDIAKAMRPRCIHRLLLGAWRLPLIMSYHQEVGSRWKGRTPLRKYNGKSMLESRKYDIKLSSRVRCCRLQGVIQVHISSSSRPRIARLLPTPWSPGNVAKVAPARCQYLLNEYRSRKRPSSVHRIMQGSLTTKWECVAWGCQSTKPISLQNRHWHMWGGQGAVLCRTGWRRWPATISHSSLRERRGGEHGSYNVGVPGSRVGFKGHRRGGACFICVASARNSGSAREELKQETVAEEICECGGIAATNTTNTKDGAIPGLILPPLTTVGKSTNILWQGCMVKREERHRMLNQKGCVIWITGLSGSGKSTLACTLDHALLERGKLSYVLDGDNVRHGLNNNLGFSAEDRAENIRRVGEVAKLFADTGVICIASFISPYCKDRDACRALMVSGEFIEVFMDVSLEVCEQRDPKGLYKLARAGKIKGFTGVDDPYEDPKEAEIVMGAVDGVYASPQDMAAQILTYLEENGFLRGPSGCG